MSFHAQTEWRHSAKNAVAQSRSEGAELEDASSIFKFCKPGIESFTKRKLHIFKVVMNQICLRKEQNECKSEVVEDGRRWEGFKVESVKTHDYEMPSQSMLSNEVCPQLHMFSVRFSKIMNSWILKYSEVVRMHSSREGKCELINAAVPLLSLRSSSTAAIFCGENAVCCAFSFRPGKINNGSGSILTLPKERCRFMHKPSEGTRQKMR